MAKWRRAAKVDANQAEIVELLRRSGYAVSTGKDDILVGRYGVTLWVEIKSPGGKLTPQQRCLQELWKGAYLVASSFDEIHEWFQENVQC